MRNASLQTGLKFLDSWLGYRAGQLDYPGFAVAVYYEDRVMFEQGYGLADTEYGEPLTADHIFCVASQSKMFTAIAILQLVQQGNLRLDDTACDYIPWLAGHRDSRLGEVTIRQLLSHTAGLMRDLPEMDFATLRAPFPTATTLRKTILNNDLIFEPNTQPKYSNLGFALLGLVIKAVSGLTYPNYLREHIIKPIGLTNTFADYAPTMAKRLPTGYGAPFDRLRPALGPRTSPKALSPAMSVHATVADMCRFAATQFYGNERLLSDRLKKEMQRSAWNMTHGYDTGAESGLGLAVEQIGERRVIGHTGHLAGHTSATFFDPHDRLAVSVAGNCKDLPIMQMIRGIFEALDWFALTEDAPTRKDLARFSVRVCGPTAIVDIVTAGNRIAVIDPDDWEPFTWYEELTPINATTLRIITKGSLQSEGELIHFTFRGSTVETVRYGGVALVPEAAYRQQLALSNKK